MSRKKILNAIQAQGLLLDYMDGGQEPARLFETSQYEYEVSVCDPHGDYRVHTGPLGFVLEEIKAQGQHYREWLESEGLNE